MKINRLKRSKRILTFYKSIFGFREPYQLLLDGTFCRTALQCKVNIREQIPKYLDGQVKLLTTYCALHEIEALGPQFYGTLVILKQFPVHECGHEKNALSAAKCFQSMVGIENSSHYMIATQDKTLKDKLRHQAGVPIIYLHFNAPVLEKPSDFSEQAADEHNANRVRPSEFEQDSLKRLKNEAGVLPEDIHRKKKRKTRGPNPLSCKKKQKKTVTPDVKKTGRRRFRVKTAKHIKAQTI